MCSQHQGSNGLVKYAALCYDFLRILALFVTVVIF